MSAADARVRVVIADDHPFFRDGVSRGLSQDGRVVVVAEAGNGRDALEAIRRERPDVALVDYKMPDLDGLAIVRAAVRDELPTRVLLLSAHTDSALVFDALQEGAAGFVPKDAGRADIIEAVLKVARGESVVPADVASGLAGEIRRARRFDRPGALRAGATGPAGLRPRAFDPSGRRELLIGASTVKTHTQRLYEKLGVSDRAAAVAEAMRRGLLE